MLSIRLSRIGKKHSPMYRLVISEKARDPYGKALEILGSYNPQTKDLTVKADRIKHWLDNGAEMTPTVNNLLVSKKIVEGKTVKNNKITKKRLEKINKNKEVKEEKKQEKKEEAPIAEEAKEEKADEKVEEKKEETPAEEKKEEEAK